MPIICPKTDIYQKAANVFAYKIIINFFYFVYDEWDSTSKLILQCILYIRFYLLTKILFAQLDGMRTDEGLLNYY